MRSTLSRRAREWFTTVACLWESVDVSPWPGKCLATESTPASSRPREYAVPSAATRAGFSPKERKPITGLEGLELTSTSGAKLTLMPSSEHWRPGVGNGAESHVVGEARSIGHAHGQTPLAVESHEYGDTCVLLRGVGECDVLREGAGGEEECAYAVGFHEAADGGHGG